MKIFLFFISILFSINSIGQRKEEKIIDSILVKYTGKTYQEYLFHFQKAEKEYEIEKNRIFRNWELQKNKKNQLVPSVPNVRYDTEEFPMVGIINKKTGVSILLKDFYKVYFDYVKQVEILPVHHNEKLYIVRVE